MGKKEDPHPSPIWLTGWGGHFCLPQGLDGLSQCLCLAFIKQQPPGTLSLLPCGVSQGPVLRAGCCVWESGFDELLSQGGLQ